MVINCIEGRFDQENFQTYALLEQVLLKAAKNETYEDELKKILSFYGSDFGESMLKSQLLTLSSNFPSTIEIVPFSEVRTYLQNLSPGIVRVHLSEILIPFAFSVNFIKLVVSDVKFTVEFENRCCHGRFLVVPTIPTIFRHGVNFSRQIDALASIPVILIYIYIVHSMEMSTM